jgi:hypothetical protein
MSRMTAAEQQELCKLMRHRAKVAKDDVDARLTARYVAALAEETARFWGRK